MNERWLANHVIGVSVSDAEDLLGHGFGRDHLREVLIRVARPLLRAGADLAYGGDFKEDAETGRQSFTRDLIDLIVDEQGGGDGSDERLMGRLYNHSPWPHYLDITEEDEADYIDACRFIRITRELAGLEVETDEGPATPDHIAFQRAVVLTKVRRCMTEGLVLDQSLHDTEPVPPVCARIIVGGKTSGFMGVLPGLYEEVLFCLEQRMPLYVLGGFGGAAARLAGFLSGRLDHGAALLDLDSLQSATPELATLTKSFKEDDVPAGAHSPAAALESLVKCLERARGRLRWALRNGLSDGLNARLFVTTDTAEAAALIGRGLRLCAERERRAAQLEELRERASPGSVQ